MRPFEKRCKAWRERLAVVAAVNGLEDRSVRRELLAKGDIAWKELS